MRVWGKLRSIENSCKGVYRARYLAARKKITTKGKNKSKDIHYVQRESYIVM